LDEKEETTLSPAVPDHEHSSSMTTQQIQQDKVEEKKESQERNKAKEDADSIEQSLSLEKKEKKKKIAYRINGEKFVIFDYYKPVKKLGQGAYAVVIEAIDTQTGEKVAIKKIRMCLVHCQMLKEYCEKSNYCCISIMKT